MNVLVLSALVLNVVDRQQALSFCGNVFFYFNLHRSLLPISDWFTIRVISLQFIKRKVGNKMACILCSDEIIKEGLDKHV